MTTGVQGQIGLYRKTPFQTKQKLKTKTKQQQKANTKEPKRSLGIVNCPQLGSPCQQCACSEATSEARRQPEFPAQPALLCSCTRTTTDYIPQAYPLKPGVTFIYSLSLLHEKHLKLSKLARYHPHIKSRMQTPKKVLKCKDLKVPLK